jgi:hypothetical protein
MVAVLGGCSEPVSAVNFPDNRENTGKFPGFSREGDKTTGFSGYKSATYAKIPYASKQGMLSSQQGIISRGAGKIAG